jgi:hypothetical protein
MLYSQSALRQTPGEREQVLNSIQSLGRLEESTPNTFKRNEPDIHRILNYEHLRYIALPMFRQYHEAIFMVLFPWTGDQVSGDRVS